MARRFGPEESIGLSGGSLVSPESLRYQQIADSLCAQRKPNEAVPYMLKAMEDEHNVDIFITCAFVQQNLAESLEMLHDGKLRGERSLKSKYGWNAFQDGGPLVGKFHDVMNTRPYMRVLQAIVRLAFESKKYQKAIDTIIEMFRLNPMDPMQQHKWLPTLLCRKNRYLDALYFCQVFIDIFVSRLRVSDLPPGGGTQFLPPRRDLYTVEEQEHLDLYESTILYSAALATFRLSGDCEESQMYIKAAVKANPHVMLRILRRSERPKFLNSNARPRNSPEDAQDYLWLSQDLWMEKDVWDWVNANPDAQQAVKKRCARPQCGKEETKPGEFQQCSGCRVISYCSVQCQKEAWTQHKPDCTSEQEIKAVRKAIAKGKPLSASNKIPVFAAEISGAGVIGYDPAPLIMTPEQEREEAERQRKKKEKKKEMNKKKEERRKAKKREQKEIGQIKADDEAEATDDLDELQNSMAAVSIDPKSNS